MTRRLLPLPVAILWLVGTASGQQPSVTFRAEANYIEIDAIVTDRNGDFVAGLTPDDFEVLEDGTRQDIAVFSLVDLPRVLPAPGGAIAATGSITAVPEADVSTNHRILDGRIYVLVLDDLHTAAASSPAVRSAARRFIEEHVGPGDRVAVIHTSGRQEALQGFTDNRRLLLASTEQFIGQKPRSATIERIERAEQRLQSTNRPDDVYRLDRISDPLEQQRALFARRMLESLEQASNRLAAVRGRRKALILFSEGVDYDLRNVMASPNASLVVADMGRMLAAATRANVAVYTIDPRGLTGTADDDMDVQSPIVEDPSLSFDAGGIAEEIRLAQLNLRVLSDETGGLSFVGTNRIGDALDGIVRDTGAYYLIGYQPTRDRADGRVRRIDVRLKNRPDLDVRAPQSYVAAPAPAPTAGIAGLPDLSPDLRNALDSPLPTPGLPMASAVAPFDGDDSIPSVLVSVRVGPADLRFSLRDGKYSNAFEMAILAIDAGGRIHDGDHQVLAMDLSAQNHDVVSRRGFQAASRISLKPGRYQLRIAVRETNTGTTGVVHQDVEVPDFSEAPVTISGVALTSAEASLAIPTARADERLGQILPGPVTTLREFVPEDEIALYLEIYDNRPGVAHQVEVVTRVRASDGRDVISFRNAWDAAKLAGQPGGFGYAPRIPLKELVPGDYILQVEAASTASGDATAVRQLPFRVRASGPGM